MVEQIRAADMEWIQHESNGLINRELRHDRPDLSVYTTAKHEGFGLCF